MKDPTTYLVNDDTVAAYGAALGSLVSLMLSRLAQDHPGISRRVAAGYRKGEVKLQLVTTLAFGKQHELALCELDGRGNTNTLATVVVSAAGAD